MGNHFNVKARQSSEYILKHYEYCLVTPLKKIDKWGNVEEGDAVKCTTVEEVEDLYNSNYDVKITTPDGCNY